MKYTIIFIRGIEKVKNLGSTNNYNEAIGIMMTAIWKLKDEICTHSEDVFEFTKPKELTPAENGDYVKVSFKPVESHANDEPMKFYYFYILKDEAKSNIIVSGDVICPKVYPNNDGIIEIPTTDKDSITITPLTCCSSDVQNGDVVKKTSTAIALNKGVIFGE